MINESMLRPSPGPPSGSPISGLTCTRWALDPGFTRTIHICGSGTADRIITAASIQRAYTAAGIGVVPDVKQYWGLNGIHRLGVGVGSEDGHSASGLGGQRLAWRTFLLVDTRCMCLIGWTLFE